MYEESAQDILIKDFKQKVEALFPDIPITNWGYGMDFTVGFGSQNTNLRKSRYYIDPRGQKFFHLTTYRSLLSIVNSGTFRLYNLSNSDDPNELSSFTDLAFTKEQIDHIKEGIFTFSFSHVDDLRNPRLWSEYGQVAIVFEFMNDPRDWDYYHLADIQYSTNPAFKRFYELQQEFQKRIPMRFGHDTLRDLIAFHKSPEFHWEQEVRLMNVPWLYSAHLDQYYDFKVSDHHTGFTKFVELKLYVAEGDLSRIRNMLVPKLNHSINPKVYYASHPQIKVLSIVFGDNEEKINQEKLNGLRHTLAHYISERFGYRIEVDPVLFKTK